MDRILSADEIRWIHDFLELKDIVYYDVQVEIVDHLASLIEAKWAAGSRQSFESLFFEIFKDFGDHQWRQLLAAKQRAIGVQLIRNSLSIFISFFTLPLLALTIAIYTGLYFCLLKIPGTIYYLQGSIYLLIAAVIVTWGYIAYRRPKDRTFLSYDGLVAFLGFDLIVLYHFFPKFFTLMSEKFATTPNGMLGLAGFYLISVLLIITFSILTRLRGIRQFHDSQANLLSTT